MIKIKALILNGQMEKGIDLAHVSKRISEVLAAKNYLVKEEVLKDVDIKSCLGCFNCWLKTPGVCVIDDYGRDIARKMISSDLVVYLTPVIYGGYSPELKKALDRSIPLMHPFFEKIKGEIHHKKRYDKYPAVIVVGVMDKMNSEEDFLELVSRNGLNFHNDFKGIVIKQNDDLDIIEEYFMKVEV